MAFVYLDHHSTTATDPAVLEAMIPFFSEIYGNPASRSHEAGWIASAHVEKAREFIAAAVGAQSREIIFTSGATESNQWVIQGALQANSRLGRHIIVSALDHRSILDPVMEMKERGYEVSLLPSDSTGRVQIEELVRMIRPDTILVSVIFANNEIGSLNPIREIGQVCKDRGVLFHTDAAQALGRVLMNVNDLNVDFMSLSAHKIYGPKGVGALYIRRKGKKAAIEPLIRGGGQERGLRSGTLNVPSIVGFGKAAELAVQRLEGEVKHSLQLRNYLWSEIQKSISGVMLNGHPSERLCNNLSITFEGVPASPLLLDLRGFALSTGSACSSEDPSPSHVLMNIGLSENQARSTIRIGLGRSNTYEQMDRFVKSLADTVIQIRSFHAKESVICKELK